MSKYLFSPNCSDFGKPNIEFKTFPDGDLYIRILEREEPDFLVHRLYPKQNDSLIQAILLLNGIKKAIGKEVEMIVPYLSYCRQDKTFLEGEVESAKIICKLLKDAGVKKLTTFDCHFLKKEGEFDYNGLKIKNISMSKALIAHAKEKFGELEVISPDQGSSYMVGKGKSMTKERGEYIGGSEAYRQIKEMKFDFDVKGKNVLILDDMIASGSTMINAVENIKKAGAKKVICAATHGFFLKDSFEKLSKLSDYFFVSDSIKSDASKVSIWPHLK
ncbi:MAG: ribose-phosphate diphosphokinase [Candidatus Micrarchaeota archaeon]